MDFFRIEYVIPTAGLIAVITGFVKCKIYKFLLKNGTPADGIIEDLIEEDNDGTKHFYPVVKFKNVYHYWMTLKADISVNSYSKYKKGDSVSILYDVNKPEKFIINDGRYMNGVYSFFVGGLALLMFGLFSLFF